MNEMNQLENQLQSWAPRPPSNEVAARIFDPRPAEDGFSAKARRAALPLTVLAAALIATVGPNPQTMLPHPAAPVWTAGLEEGTVGMPLNPLLGMTANDFNLQWNICAVASLGWTNRGESPSTHDSLPSARTNSLMF